MSEHLHHKLGVLHQNLLHGKLPRSVHWSDAMELISHIGQVQAQGGDQFAFIVGTRREMFKCPRTHEFGIEEVSRLRKFLKEADSESPAPRLAPAQRMIVVIDHHAAHIFRDRASTIDEGVAIEPYDPHQAHYQGDRVPEATSFYEEVADALLTADEIVLIGHGIGKSSAVDVLAEHLKKHHGEMSHRVKAVETADLSALTAPEIAAIAKRHMTSAA